MPHRSIPSRTSASLRIAVLIAFILAPIAAAQAYVGPGAGLSLLSALWGLLCAIGAAFLFVILWPLRRLRRKRREARQAREPHSHDSTTTQRDTTGSVPSRDRE